MNIKHIAESGRRVSGETAAGTHPSPEEGSDQSAYKVFFSTRFNSQESIEG